MRRVANAKTIAAAAHRATILNTLLVSKCALDFLSLERWVSHRICIQLTCSTMKKKISGVRCQVLTVDDQLVALLSSPSHTGHLAGVLASIWCLSPRDLQVMASLHVLSLSVGQDGLSFSVPGDCGKWHSTCLALQCYHCVQQRCDLCS